MKSSKKETHKWLRKHESITTGVMMNKDGIPTANKDDMFNLIREAWDKVFNKYSRGEPDPALFFQHFGSDMKSHPQQLDPLTGSRLIQTLRDIQPSSTGLDGWSIAELVALSKWYPNMLSHLANMLNLVEEIGEWPTSLVTGYTTMLPKPDGPAVPGPMDMRPISVLPHVYRLYSKTRFRDSLCWQSCWIHDRAFGGVPGRSAESLAFQVALAVEAAHVQDR